MDKELEVRALNWYKQHIENNKLSLQQDTIEFLDLYDGENFMVVRRGFCHTCELQPWWIERHEGPPCIGSVQTWQSKQIEKSKSVLFGKGACSRYPFLTDNAYVYGCSEMCPESNHSVCSSVVDTVTPISVLDIGKQAIIKRYVADITSSYNALASLPHLYPCLSVNKAFGELMAICTQIPEESVAKEILTNPQVAQIKPQLQKICSHGESNLEKYWAQKIVSSSQCQNGANSLLASFPYYSNYVDLTQMELNAIASASPNTPHRRFAFLGCGPLPLTSLCILSQLSSSPLRSGPAHFVLNIDWSPDAIASATKLCRRLAIPETSMAFSCDCAGGARNDLGDFDVVYVAALVGATTKEKREIFSRVLGRMRPGTLLVVRTAHALRKLLYPAVKIGTDLDPNVFEPLMVVHPYNHIINSVIIGRVRSPRIG